MHNLQIYTPLTSQNIPTFLLKLNQITNDTPFFDTY